MALKVIVKHVTLSVTLQIASVDTAYIQAQSNFLQQLKEVSSTTVFIQLKAVLFKHLNYRWRDSMYYTGCLLNNK